MCCPASQDEVRAALEADREGELGLRDLIARLLGRPGRERLQAQATTVGPGPTKRRTAAR